MFGGEVRAQEGEGRSCHRLDSFFNHFLGSATLPHPSRHPFNGAVPVGRCALRKRAAPEGGARGQRERAARVDGASGRRERAAREGGAGSVRGQVSNFASNKNAAFFLSTARDIAEAEGRNQNKTKGALFRSAERPFWVVLVLFGTARDRENARAGAEWAGFAHRTTNPPRPAASIIRLLSGASTRTSFHLRFSPDPRQTSSSVKQSSSVVKTTPSTRAISRASST